MKIQFNTDRTIHGDEKLREHCTDLLTKALDRYQTHISRIEVHITDQNGKKEGWNDILCLLEARIEGKHPIAVSDQADSVEQAIEGAIHKLKSALEPILDRMKDHKN